MAISKEYCSEQKDDNHKNKFCAMQLDLSHDKEKAVSVDPKYDFFGNLEVISKTAFSTLTANVITKPRRIGR